MLRTDLVIYKSERMTQDADAGGQRTAIQVENEKLNDVFGNISEIDHAQSAVDIAKVFPTVKTNNNAMLQDAHILVNEPPEDPLVEVMLMESSGINDASLRSDIVELIESAVIAGQLLRSGISQMLAGQDTFNPLNLQQASAAPGEQAVINLIIGQVIVIAVEYTGSESQVWPRFTHYARILKINETIVQFTPAIPKVAPGPSVVINGQNRCTVLRATNTGQGVSYHGTTRLTGPATGTTLSVNHTSGQIVPRITQLERRVGNQPFATDGGMVFSVLTIPVSGVFYSIEIADYAVLPGSKGRVFIDYVSLGVVRQKVLLNDSFVGDLLEFVLDFVPDVSSVLTIRYFSDRYQTYTNNAPIPMGWSLIMTSVIGDVANPVGGRITVYRDLEAESQFRVLNDALFQLAVTLAPDGSALYYNGYSDFVYSAVIENDSISSGSASQCIFVLPFNEVSPSTFYVSVELISGGLLSASSDAEGHITGVGVTGVLTGIYVSLSFTNPVNLSSLTYQVDEVVLLTPPASLYGINPVRLVNGGAVDLFRPFGVICVSNNTYHNEAALTSAQQLTLRAKSFIDIVDSLGRSLWNPLDSHYSYNAHTGVVTIVDTNGFVGPYEVIDALSELRLVTGVSATSLKINTPLLGNYPAGSVVSSVVRLGDLQAKVSTIFDQSIWTGAWQDMLSGSPAIASYNNLNYPIIVLNQSAISDRWVILFTSDTAFRCISEALGEIATGDTLNDFSPTNPATGLPYFSIPSAGWGSGWQPGECLRFNTVAASRALVAVRSVSAGHAQVEQDSIRLFFRGNAE